MEFWYNNPHVLYTYYYDVIPSTNDELNRKLNALARLSLYIGVLLTIFVFDARFLLIPLLVFSLTLALYSHEQQITESMETHKKKLYQSTNNPYMNPVFGDHIQVERSPKNNETPDETVDNTVSDLADEQWGNLWNTTPDAYESNIAKRQFYSIPEVDPVESKKNMMNFVSETSFPSDYSCKEGNGEQCFENQNVGYFELQRT